MSAYALICYISSNCVQETPSCEQLLIFVFISVETGASTVSLDLDKKWLDRIRPQMEANGIAEWDGKHDCIYGDVSATHVFK